MNVLFITAVLLVISVVDAANDVPVDKKKDAVAAGDPKLKKHEVPPSSDKTQPSADKDAASADKSLPSAAKSLPSADKSAANAVKIPGANNDAASPASRKTDDTGKGKPAMAPNEGADPNRKPFPKQIVNDGPAIDDSATKNKVGKPVPKTKDEKQNKDKNEPSKKGMAPAMPEPKATTTEATGTASRHVTSWRLITIMLGVLTVLIKYNS